jgi:hypothetical protein
MYKMNEVKRFVGDEWEVIMQDHNGYLYLHCNMTELKASVLREINGIMDTMLDWAYDEGYDGIHAFTENRHLARLSGARHIGDAEYEGMNLGIYKWQRE